MPQLVPTHFCLHALRKAVCEAVTGALGIEPEFHVCWPSWPPKDAPPHRHFVCVELALGAALDGRPLLVCFEAPLALALVERTLGTKGSAGPSHTGTQLSLAEEGVLAFLLTRLMRHLGSARVLGVFRGPLPERSEHVVVPIRVKLATVESALYVFWPEAEHAFSPGAHALALELSIDDHLEPDSLAKLSCGDLLTFDRAPLRNAGGELSGTVTAALEGIDERLEMRLQSTSLTRDKRRSSELKSANTHVTIWQSALPVSDAARLYRGEPVDLGALPGRFILRHAQGQSASGNLVLYGGELALEVTDLNDSEASAS